MISRDRVERATLIVTLDQAGIEFSRLVALMAKLRAPDGCPWDREQSFDTIKKYTLEEAYEVLDAIDARDWPALCEELGDLLLQPVFYAQMASEEGLFDIAQSLRAINEKLIRRHPHVFGEGDAKTSDEVLRKWDEIKSTEKPERKLTLDGIPKSFPALLEAREISKRAAKVGFDWENAGQVVEKLHEELNELETATSDTDREGEIGDLFFVLVNLARFHNVDPELALRKTNAKFRRRFAHLEEQLGDRLTGAPIAEMEALWQQAKARESESGE